MLKLYNLNNLNKASVEKLCRRNTGDNPEINFRVEQILSRVKQGGDAALKVLTEELDGVKLQSLFLNKPQLQELAQSVSESQKEALQTAFQNIRKFHQSQIINEGKIETTAGVTCWRSSRPIEKVGLYIPGGTAVLPSTFLMLAIPAKLAGCKEIVVCSPPQKNGLVNGFLAYCALLLNIDRIYLAGGAQAIAAMAYGTETITKVDKIFGPGNQYVTRAKTLIQDQTAIDMPAGPSEVLVVADETANPAYVAADLLAQAEHGIDSQVVLVSTSTKLIDETLEEVEKQLSVLPREDIAAKALQNSFAIKTDSLQEAMQFSNLYAPEHLILATDQWEDIAGDILNAGSVFLGHLTPESAGDYASGTNHTLPTSAYARAYSGVSVDSFVKKITFQHISSQGIQNLGPTVEILAELEGLEAHKNAVRIRLDNLNV
ncbi:MAG TPA: histidinol dehydrogenase [Daejeonella sp.]|nr:histidinol dehydrogenase [Daejeonella sp.]